MRRRRVSAAVQDSVPTIETSDSLTISEPVAVSQSSTADSIDISTDSAAEPVLLAVNLLAVPPKSRARRPRRAAVTTTENGESTTETEAIPPSAEPVVPPTTAVAESPTTPVRRRGPRAGVPIAAPPTPTIAVSIPVVEPSISSLIAAPDTTDTKPKRTRGVKSARTTVPTAPSVVPTASVPEPLPVRYKPLPADVLARLPESKIVMRKGVPELVINGEPRLPFLFFVNTEDSESPDAATIAAREIRLAYDAGIRLFTLLVHLPWKSKTGERRFDPLESMLRFVTDNAPDALILPRLIFSPPVSWAKAHADEMIQYSDGETGDISIASDIFWADEADSALRAAVEHIVQSDFAGRVFGFYLEHGEWFHEKGRGYDISPANILGFRSWLRMKYKGSLVALRAAWHDGSATFDNALIPNVPSDDSNYAFLNEREQRIADFHEYSSDVTANTILDLAATVKEASGNRSAVAVSYGYSLELPRPASGHLALATLLDSPQIDILTGPVSYSGRAPGGSATFPVPIDSVTLAGKLWISEDDTKTYLADDETPDDYNPKVADAPTTMAVQWRNFGAAIARNAGLSWMDLWGSGWLDGREVWANISNMRALGDLLATRRRNPRTKPAPDPDVAVLVDERALFAVRDDNLTTALVDRMRDLLLRSGVRVGFYLLSDLTKKNFPNAKLLLFLNAFKLDDGVRAAIRDRWQNDGRTLAWMYAPGGGESGLIESADTIGMQLRLQPWGSKTGSVIVDERSPLTEGLRGERLGEEMRLNPSFTVNDNRATVVGEYIGNGAPSIAIRKHARWQSVFIGEREISHTLLRGLYRLAGVPLYTPDDDAAWIGDNLLTLHSAPGGGTTIYLPEEAVVWDAVARETLSGGGWGARFSMPPKGTRLLFWGTPAEVARLGGDPNGAPMGLSPDEVPNTTTKFVFDDAAVQKPNPVDDLMLAALAGEFGEPVADDDSDGEESEAEKVSPLAAADETGDSEAANDKKKKRRRRKRGRGTGEETVAGDGEATESDETTADTEMVETATVSVRTVPTLSELLPLSETLESDDAANPPDAMLLFDEAGEPNGVPSEQPTVTLSQARRRRSREQRQRQEMSIEREAAVLLGEDPTEAETALMADEFILLPELESVPEVSENETIIGAAILTEENEDAVSTDGLTIAD